MVWDQQDYNGLINATKQNIGQISLQSDLGKNIYKYAIDDNYSTFLEIGTWNGLGSTKCFIEGFKNRTSPFVFYSLECNSEKSQSAQKLYKDISNVHILNEVLFNYIPDDLYNIFPILTKDETYKYWNTIDFENVTFDQPISEANVIIIIVDNNG